MSKKLYPPNIGGTIPAFCGTVITVPFSMNRAVGIGEVGGFALKIKTVNGEYKGFKKVLQSKESFSEDEAGYNLSSLKARFDVSDIDFVEGQYYKLQLAYIYIDENDEETVGYYSTVGVVKYTTVPNISIDGLLFGHINTHNYSYTGVYSQLNGDTTEKMYYYRFQVFDGWGNTVEDTDFVLHKQSEDDLVYEQHASFSLARDLNVDESYYIQFSVKTTNGLELKTSKYKIMQRRAVSPEIEAQLIATNDFDNGLVRITIEDKVDPVISGRFLISRSCDKNGWVWEAFRKFDLRAMEPHKWELLDCTVEQGVKYKYSLQQYNDYEIYSDRIVSNAVLADFEDSFLYDGDKQLKIRFNPQVSSFNTTILESKTETIGSKYPFISRNGNVGYKDIPIGGLISYQMDDAELFMTKKELGIETTMTNLVTENITAERIFKIAVMEWLSNGKPKLFKTPTEGNFVVYLMGVSLSPENGLGRMLHSFSCTATEIGEFNLKTLEYYDLIDVVEELEPQIRWSSIHLPPLTLVYHKIIAEKDAESEEEKWVSEFQTLINNRKLFIQTEDETYEPLKEELYLNIQPNDVYYWLEIDRVSKDMIKLNETDVYSVAFSDMTPGSIVQIGTETIQIGATGQYSFESKNPITYIGVQKNSTHQGVCTYTYQATTANVFNNIRHVEIIDVPIRQFIGDHYKTVAFPGANPEKQSVFTSQNILDIIQDSKTDVLNINFIRFIKRPMIDVYVYREQLENIMNYQAVYGEFFEDMDCKHKIQPNSDLYIYPIRLRRDDYRQEMQEGVIKPYLNEGYFISAMSQDYAPYTGYAVDGLTGNILEINNNFFKTIINDEPIELNEIEQHYIEQVSTINSIINNPGVLLELSYCKQLKTYGFEIDNARVKRYKEEYLQAQDEYDAARSYSLEDTSIDLEAQFNYVVEKYHKFITELNKVIINYKKDNGLEL